MSRFRNQLSPRGHEGCTDALCLECLQAEACAHLRGAPHEREHGVRDWFHTPLPSTETNRKPVTTAGTQRSSRRQAAR